MYVLLSRSPTHVLRFALGDRLVVGRGSECGAVVVTEGISRKHFRIERSGDGFVIEDLGSKNGTWVGGERLSGARELRVGEAFRAGEAELVVEEVSTDDFRVARPIGPVGRLDPETGATGAAAGGPCPFSARLFEEWLEIVSDDAIDIGSAARRALDGLLRERAFPWAAAYRVDRADLLLLAETSGIPEPIRRARSVAELRNATGGQTATFPSSGEPLLVVVLPQRGAPNGSGNGAVDETGRILLRLLEAKLPLARKGAPRPRREDGGSKAARLPAGVVAPEGSAFARVLDELRRIARTRLPVLILGETGSGKEIAARFLHDQSDRREAPFVALNCAALPRDLLDAELFGIEDRVATGVSERPGKFELAGKGTLFLDEIADMTLETQAKILRVLQEREVHRIGGHSPRKVACRVVAATNRDLQAEIGARRFREDLYFRLASFTATIPPLRERRGEIAELVRRRLEELVREHGRSVAGVSVLAMRALEEYDWPGNVRELLAEVERVFFLADPGGVIDSRLLGQNVRDAGEESETAMLEGGCFDAAVRRFERRYVEKAIQRAEGNLTRAARALGLPKATFFRRIKSLGIGSKRAER